MAQIQFSLIKKESGSPERLNLRPPPPFKVGVICVSPLIFLYWNQGIFELESEI